MSKVDSVNMEVEMEGGGKRTLDEVSSDSADSTPQSPVFKKTCVSSSVPTSPVRHNRSHSLPSSPYRNTRSQFANGKGNVKVITMTKEQILSNQHKKKLRVDAISVESLSLQIASLSKTMEEFSTSFKRDSDKILRN